MRTELISAVLFAALLSAPAQAAPKTGESVAVTACPVAGVTASCLMITGADGTVFNITAADPKPAPGRVIELRGTATDKVSMCAQGIVLENIQWTPTQQACPK